MNNIDNFKEFVKKNPTLIKHVKNGSMTWQKFYELYAIYGEDDSVWKEYLMPNNNNNIDITKIGFNDVLNWVKKIDLNTVQSGVNNLQRVIGVLHDLSANGKNEVTKPEYKPRPLYRHFED